MMVLKPNRAHVLASPGASIREVYTQPGPAPLSWLRRAGQPGYLLLGAGLALLLCKVFWPI